MKFLSQETIDTVKKVSVYEVAEKLGFHLKRVGTHWNLRCPNPNHHEKKDPDTYIKISTGYYKCYGGGGCGSEGYAINFYSWNQFGGYDSKRDFYRSVEGIADLMGIPIKYTDGTVVQDGSRAVYVPREQPKVIEVPAASADICDRTYRRFLDLCPVYDEHLAEWLGPKRQYTKEQIGVIGFRSIPRDFAMAKKIVDTLIAEGYQIERVPGFTQFVKRGGNPQNEADWYWLIAGMGKYYIPVRDDLGRIIRLRLRTNFEDKKKYVWFSSAPMNEGNVIRRGGAASGAPVNVVVPTNQMAIWEPGTEITDICTVKKVLIIEGEHKSYITANRLNMVVMGLPGVGNFREVVPLLKKWGVEEAAIAYDIDAFYDKSKPTGKNENVFKQLVRFGKELISEEGIQTNLWAWNPSDAKGLDDLLLLGKFPVVTDLRTNERYPFIV
ncbi:CHC2 zinc finger domain-containing protein [Paenibacillus sp. Y412MC10]|uniref:CHC2 zinc finger domain-containing protein n=1 Tax=Geobacillus sp. (strain Y412MC10) TaxID=481743 RepID=UPI0011AB6EA3|nr:CHC2 zinc finger domain-containing protein [Paenibacillus sp. Y412MC10]